MIEFIFNLCTIPGISFLANMYLHLFSRILLSADVSCPWLIHSAILSLAASLCVDSVSGDKPLTLHLRAFGGFPPSLPELQSTVESGAKLAKYNPSLTIIR